MVQDLNELVNTMADLNETYQTSGGKQNLGGLLYNLFQQVDFDNWDQTMENLSVVIDKTDQDMIINMINSLEVSDKASLSLSERHALQESLNDCNSEGTLEEIYGCVGFVSLYVLSVGLENNSNPAP